MYTLSYYDRSKFVWDDEEVAQLDHEYKIQKKNVLECANIHKRTPGCIAYKLKSMGLIDHNTHARGYKDYVMSDLYNEIVSSHIKERDDKNKSISQKNTSQKTTNINIMNEIITLKSDIIELKNDVKEILNLSQKPKNIMNEINIVKSDIAELKDDVKEILKLIHSIYEFENGN
jgi:hypothetical protein